MDKHVKQLSQGFAKYKGLWDTVDSDASGCLRSMVNLAVRLDALTSTESPLLEKYAGQKPAVVASLVREYEAQTHALAQCMEKLGAVQRQMVKLLDTQVGVQPTMEHVKEEAVVREVHVNIRRYSCEYWRRVQLLKSYNHSRQVGELESLQRAWGDDQPYSYLS